MLYGTHGRRPAEARSRARAAAGAQSRRAASSRTRRALTSANALEIFRTTTSSSTAPTTSRRAISSTTRACCSASRTSTAASSASTARRRCSRPRAVRAIAACIRSRRRPAWCPSCAEGGVLGVLPGIIGTIQATEAIKLILGIGEHARRPAAALRRAGDEFRTLKLRRDPECPVCGDHPTVTSADRLRAVLRHHAGDGVGRAALPRGARDDGRGAQGADRSRGAPSGSSTCASRSEFEICRIPGSTLIPLGELPKRLAGAAAAPGRARHRRPLQDGRPQREGRRAAARARIHERVQNLKGGILAWISTGSTRRRPSTSRAAGGRHRYRLSPST